MRPSPSPAADAFSRTSATALVFVGFQQEFFAASGSLYSGIAGPGVPERVLAATVALIDRLAGTDALIVSAPMAFSPTYDELPDPVGLLAAIKANRAFQRGTSGVELPDELQRFSSRIEVVSGRIGFDAFAGTGLDASLRERGITDVVVAGALTCLCVHATARAAHARGFRVCVLSDCSMAQTGLEHVVFCQTIFPLFGQVLTSEELLGRLVGVNA